MMLQYGERQVFEHSNKILHYFKREKFIWASIPRSGEERRTLRVHLIPIMAQHKENKTKQWFKLHDKFLVDNEPYK